MSTWKAYLQSGHSQGAVFGLHIEGCERLFVTSIPLKPDGTPWAAPQSSGTFHVGHQYIVDDSLILTAGLQQTTHQWEPKMGVCTGGAGSFSLVASPAIRELFAAEDPTMNMALIRENVAYDHAGVTDDRYRVRVNSTTGWPASGYLHIGRETMWYDQKGADYFGDPADTNPALLRRGMWQWRAASRLSRQHKAVMDNYVERLPVASKIRDWYGRRVTLLCWPCDQHGYCLDDGYRGPHEIEVWSGFIRSVGPAEDSWGEFKIDCMGLTEGLRHEIGYDSIKGTVGAPEGERIVWINGTGRIQEHRTNWMELYVWDDSLIGASTTTRVDHPRFVIKEDGTGAALHGWYYLSDLVSHIAKTLTAQINLDLLGLFHPATPPEVRVDLEAQRFTEEGLVLGSITCTAFALGQNFAVEFIMPSNRGLTRVFPFWERSAVYRFYDVGNTWDVRRETLYRRDVFEGEGFTPSSADVLFYLDDSLGPTPPASGYARITFDGASEVVYYTSIVQVGDSVRGLMLRGTRRGMFGSQAINYPVFGDNRATIEFLLGIENKSFLRFAGEVLTSTGTAGAYGALDTMAREWGLAIDPAVIDLPRFQNEAIHPPFSIRTFLLSGEITLEELLQKEAIFLGFTILPRILDDGSYRLTWVPMEVALQHTDGFALAMGNGGAVLPSTKPSLRLSSTDIITAINAQVHYDAATGEHVGEPYQVVNANRIEQHGHSTSLDVEVVGVAAGEWIAAATAMAARLFYLFGRPTYAAEFVTDQRGLAAQPGDLVRLTVPGLPTPYSAIPGLVNAPARVVQSDVHWFEPGEKVAARLRCIIYPEFYGISPGWSIASYDAGLGRITVEDNEYTDAADPSPLGEDVCRDWHYGPLPGEQWDVWVWAPGDVENRVARRITGMGSAVFGIDGVVGAGDRMCCQDWDDIVAAQKLYVHIARTTDTLGAGDEPPHTWSP